MECADLHGHFLAQTNDFVNHFAVAKVLKVALFLGNQIVDAVQGHASVVANDASSAVSIRQTGQDMIVAHALHLAGIGIKHAVVVGLDIACEDVMQLLRRLITIGCASLFGHFNTAIRHESAFQWLVGLQADYAFQVFRFMVDVARSVCRQSRNHLSLHVEYAALGPLFLLKCAQFLPQYLRGTRRLSQEMLIAGVARIVILNEIPQVHFCLPLVSFETSPFCSHHSVKFMIKK